jgi:hypothetical protein
MIDSYKTLWCVQALDQEHFISTLSISSSEAREPNWTVSDSERLKFHFQCPTAHIHDRTVIHCTVKIECRIMYWCADFWERHGKPKLWTCYMISIQDKAIKSSPSHPLYMAFAKLVGSNNCQLICWSCAGKLIIVICQVPFQLKFQTWANCKVCKSSGLPHYLRSRVGQLALHAVRFPFCAKWELIFCLPVGILWSEFWVLTSA